MNIKELREKDARRLAERINPDPTLEEINEALAVNLKMEGLKIAIVNK